LSHSPLIVGLGGTLRPGSTSETALTRALATAQASGARTQLFAGAFLASLPTYDPRAPDGCAERDALLAAMREARGVIIASPGYHGSISGLVKNALDCLEDLRDDPAPYLDGRAVGLIVSASGPQAAASTLAALRAIVHALRGWPTPFGAALNSEGLFDADGTFANPHDAWAVQTVARQVAAFARTWSSAPLPASEAGQD
jgi:FMN reductase